jgi:glycosyltransferase involved in cell wall biosynthesis
MRIGVDAKWFFDGPPSGRRVVRNLAASLVTAGSGHELHFFFDRRHRGEALPMSLPVPTDRRHYVWGRNNQLSNVLLVSRLADRLGLDAVVYQNFVPPPRLARHARIAFVHDVIFESDPNSFTARERLYFAPLRFLTAGADRVCTVSSSERSRLVRYHYASDERIDVVPNGVDRLWKPRACYPTERIARVLEHHGVAEPFALFVGRLNARKNVAGLVRAMALVRTRGLSLVVVGSPDATTGDLEGLASRVAPDRVRFAGAVPDADLCVLYAACAVFCFPSTDEGFGLAPLEAMAAGAPTIVSELPALLETCGDAAMYVPPTDPAAIAAAIDDLIADETRRARLRALGFRRARELSWDRAAERLLMSVSKAVAREKGRRAS